MTKSPSSTIQKTSSSQPHNQSQPLISLVVPVYNVKPYLRRCLDSVLAQTYQNFEAILTDDGSTDHSGIICDSYAAKDPRFKVIHQQNGGLSHARNTGLAHARGEYLAFLDSDDSITPDYLSYLYHLIVKYETKLSICPLIEIYDNGRIINQGANHHEAKLTQAKCLERMLLEQGFNVCAYAKLYHKSLFKNLTFPEGKLHEDLGTTYQPIMRTDYIAYGSKPQYNYYIRQGSIATSAYSDRKLDIITLTDQMCDTIDVVHPDLKQVTNLRRMHARFSVLRQMPGCGRLTHRQQKDQQKIISYLKTHSSDITNNPHATRRDLLAIRTLRFGLPVFRASWRIYRLFH